jgi:hypothetical protein
MIHRMARHRDAGSGVLPRGRTRYPIERVRESHPTALARGRRVAPALPAVLTDVFPCQLVVPAFRCPTPTEAGEPIGHGASMKRSVTR